MQFKKYNPFSGGFSDNIVYIAFVIVFVIFSVFLSDAGFLTMSNVMNIIRQTAMITIMAVAMTFVISSAEIDLSVGSIAALSAMTTALSLQLGLGVVVSSFVGLGTGFAIGLINGLLVSKVLIPSFLVTLAMMEIARGLAMWITGTAPVAILNGTYNTVFGSGKILGMPILLYWTLLISIIGFILLNKTSYGRKVLATGGNEKASMYTGINTKRIKLSVFIFSGMMAGFAGMLYAGRLQAGRYTFGEGDELSVIAAVILGGTSLFGGVGSVIGTVIGSIMIGTINNGLILFGLDVSQQKFVLGLIIILAVAFGKKSK